MRSGSSAHGGPLRPPLRLLSLSYRCCHYNIGRWSVDSVSQEVRRTKANQSSIELSHCTTTLFHCAWLLAGRVAKANLETGFPPVVVFFPSRSHISREDHSILQAIVLAYESSEVPESTPHTYRSHEVLSLRVIGNCPES